MRPLTCTVLLTAMLAAGCGPKEAPQQTTDARSRPDNPAPDVAPAVAPGEAPGTAAAQLAATQGNTVTGSLVLADSPQGVRVSGAIQGLAPDSEFGFHVHEKGDCSAPDASSAGGHFNPSGQQHGKPDSGAHHVGDMHNLKSNAEGTAQVDTTLAGAAIQAGRGSDVLGKAVVVHAAPDDYTTQPSGNSGARLACGVITIQAPTTTTGQSEAQG